VNEKEPGWSDPPGDAWHEWMRTGSLASRDRLVEHYLPLARSVAGRIFRGRTAQGVPFDDYLQYARIGLLESVSRFDPTRGAPFSAYALHRIRGAILNGLSQETELAAQREAARRIARERRESLLARMPGGVEQATLEELIEVTVGLALGDLLENAEEMADESPSANPYAAAEVLQLKRLARMAVERLPVRERELIRAHYYEHREFRDLAQQWALSTGRISQLHARAMAQLRQLLVAQPRLNRRL
jgi:RNA polymerase sigma factor for flagellar operon FliA